MLSTLFGKRRVCSLGGAESRPACSESPPDTWSEPPSASSSREFPQMLFILPVINTWEVKVQVDCDYTSLLFHPNGIYGYYLELEIRESSEKVEREREEEEGSLCRDDE